MLPPLPALVTVSEKSLEFRESLMLSARHQLINRCFYKAFWGKGSEVQETDISQLFEQRAFSSIQDKIK